MRSLAGLGFLLLIFCCNPLYSQQPYNFKFKTYTASNGLVHNFTKKCLKDSKGFLWIITQHGLSRFDGVNFKNFEHSNADPESLPENDLEDIAIDGGDNIWLSYKTGLCLYNQSTHHFTIIRNRSNVLKSWAIVYDKKRNCIWSVNPEGYTKIDAKSLTTATTSFLIKETFSPEVNPVLLDSKDRLWIPYQRSRYHCIELATGRQYYYKKRIEPVSFYEDEEKNIWLATWQSGFRKIMVKDTVHEHELYGSPFLKIATNEYDYISQGVAQSSTLTGDSILWVIQNTGGLLLFNRNKKEFVQHFTHDANDKNGIATDYNEYIYSDPSGIMWICTWHGLTKINKQEQQFVSREIPWLNNQLYNCVAGIMNDPFDNDIGWLSANGSGITKYRKSTGELLNKYFFYFSGNSFTGRDENYDWRWTDHFIKDEANNLWTISYAGLIKISGNTVTKIPIRDSRNEILYPYAFKQFSQGFLWIAAEKGLIKVNIKDNSFTVFEDPKATGAYDLGDIEQLDENTILTSSYKGIRSFNILTRKFSAFTSPFISTDSANETSCLAMELIDGKLYMGTLAGLKVLDLASRQSYFIGKEQGINKIYHHRLHKDKNNNLWIFTSGGLFKYETNKKNFEKFTTADGIYDLSDDAINFFSYNEQVYIGYRMAVTSFDPGQVNINTIKTNPVITEVQVNGETINQSLTPFQTGRLQLGYDENEIIFNYTAPDFTNADKISFQYQLEGYDKEWVSAGTRRRVTYNNLPPGKYTFKLKVANSSGLWNEKTTTFQFKIATPFWRTWWFISLVILSLASLGYLLYRYRVKEVKKIYEVRSNISRSLHDDVGATLSSINIYSDVARHKTNDPSVKQLIDKVYDASANAMENMSDIVWYVNPKNDLLENLLIRMREYALPLLEARGINVVFDARENIEDLKTTMQQRHNLYLIFKEAINNALKYAAAKNMVILLEKEANLMKMEIRDDGKGFDAGSNYSGNGIKNMHFRAQAISGKLNISSSPGNGSQVSLHFPIT